MSPKARASTQKTPHRYDVLRVVDGDTVHVAYHGDTTIRLIGIDTPETVSPSVPDECGGQAASNVAHELLDGKRVTVQLDPSQGRLDHFGRTLAYLGVPGVGDYGLAMIRRGRAVEYTYDTPYRKQHAYRAAEAEARALDKHLWRQCGGADTPLKPTPTPTPTARAAAHSSGGGNCEPGYSPCLPVTGDLNCSDVDGPVTVTGDDPYGLDADGDGTGCDS
jgi:endonuclease YncB( thermonuclease family)